MIVIALDPGTEKTAFVTFDKKTQQLRGHGYLPNHKILEMLTTDAIHCHLAIEQIGHYGTGMPAGREVFDTCVWIGQFIQRWVEIGGRFDKNTQLILRSRIKGHICGKASAKDPHVAQALRDRFGERKTKKNPSGFFPASGEGWCDHNYAALAVAVTYADNTPNVVEAVA